MGGNSSSYDTTDAGIQYKVDEISTDAIYEILRTHDIDEDVRKLLKQASSEIHDFDSYRGNMKILAYGDNATYIITAGEGENLLEVQPDGSGDIKCTWIGHSIGAKILKVWCPKMFSFLKKALQIIGGVRAVTY